MCADPESDLRYNYCSQTVAVLGANKLSISCIRAQTRTAPEYKL